MAATITPTLSNIIFDDMYVRFFQYIIRVGIRSNTANDQKYITYFVRNNKGIPTIVIPIKDNVATIPKHKLWQICHPPRKLKPPERLEKMFAVLALTKFCFLNFFLIQINDF